MFPTLEYVINGSKNIKDCIYVQTLAIVEDVWKVNRVVI